jgi:MYXO-CTERM domain-containing protein
MAGYDPKAKRTHSPAAAAGPAPVDDLLGAHAPAEATTPEPPPETSSAPTAEPVRPAVPSAEAARVPSAAPRVTPPEAAGPDPRVLAVVAGVAVLAVVLWRRRRR